MQTTHNKRPELGFGLGLRRELVQPLIERRPAIDWLEILSDGYLNANAEQLAELEQIHERYPLVMHGGALSVGGPDPLDRIYLAQLKTLADRIQPALISDHLCWTPPGMSHSYDLRPLPHTLEMIDHLIPRIRAVQDTLGQPILLENIPDTHPRSAGEMPEWEFISRVAESSDSLILLDLNNIVLNSVPQGFEPSTYIINLPAERIWQIHLAPLMNKPEYEWDTGSDSSPDPVWNLYLKVIGHCGPVPTMLERNDDIPPLDELLMELEQVKAVATRA
ncbi:MAG: DUF692 domain-containing protein [Pseudomonadota bacterium]